MTDCVRVQVRERPYWRRNCVVIGRDAHIGSNVNLEVATAKHPLCLSELEEWRHVGRDGAHASTFGTENLPDKYFPTTGDVLSQHEIMALCERYQY